MNDDERFEEYLRNFRPLAARPLRSKTVSMNGKQMAFMAASFALVILILLLPRSGRKAEADQRREVRQVTVMNFNAAAKRGNLDRALDEEAQQTMPRTDQPQTALNTLARE